MFPSTSGHLAICKSVHWKCGFLPSFSSWFLFLWCLLEWDFFLGEVFGGWGGEVRSLNLWVLIIHFFPAEMIIFLLSASWLPCDAFDLSYWFYDSLHYRVIVFLLANSTRSTILCPLFALCHSKPLQKSFKSQVIWSFSHVGCFFVL